MTATPTGYRARAGDRDAVAFERTFRAPVEDVWAAVTEPERLARWIGTWQGDPASGSVRFRMNAEGEENAHETTYLVRRCEPPALLEVHSKDEFGDWQLVLELTEADGVTTLRLLQILTDPAALENTGPGWEWYLDRLVAAETGGDVGALDWDADYYPAMKAYYEAL